MTIPPFGSAAKLRLINLDTYYTNQVGLVTHERTDPYLIHENSEFAKFSESQRKHAVDSLSFLEGHVHPYFISVLMPLVLRHPELLIGHGHSKNGYFVFAED